MHTYTPRTFALGTLEGLSEEQVKVHIALYEGYVKHVNVLREQIAELTTLDKEKYAFAIMETRRRLGFEFNGMRMHEYFFEQFEGEKSYNPESKLALLATKKYGDGTGLIGHIKEVAATRGIGWVVVYYDQVADTLHTTFVADHELGQLGGLPIILALDMWEHAFMVDYRPATKKDYVEAFLKNMNWSVAEKRFDAAQK